MRDVHHSNFISFQAVASLVRSVTPRSLYTLHTGFQSYGTESPIPAGAIAVEDAILLQSLQVESYSAPRIRPPLNLCNVGFES
jgi:hypothetical protein